ncbi:MAG: serine/threonine protein kinase [Bacteriovoracaceae bacterium]|nr:serine/threonine protein kinase [Bacteriovoracaceae bacterium]
MGESEFKARRFNRYLLLDHLVDGGMATIYRARELSENMVADKIVAIKVIKEVHSQNSDFKDMFLDEIKVAFGLVHPNISQTYHYGDCDNQLFAVLEYVDGKNLKEFGDLLKKKETSFPVEMAVYMTSQICQGLDYAHKFTDKLSGLAFNIIHRDISPHNIMMDYDGIVKVIDFGIAKAQSNTEETQAGTIKGKISYLAPEYLQENTVLDHRYDQFAVGLVLWELLMGKQLFTGKNDMMILRQIYECKIPKPTKLNPKIPAELEKILLKSLSKKREKRYKDLDQFNRALTKFLYTNYPDFNSNDLQSFLQKMFAKEISKNQKKLRKFGEIDAAPFVEDLKEELAARKNKGINEQTMSSMDTADSVSKKREFVERYQKLSNQNALNDAIRDSVKQMVFGSTSITDDLDKTISAFIMRQRQQKTATSKKQPQKDGPKKIKPKQEPKPEIDEDLKEMINGTKTDIKHEQEDEEGPKRQKQKKLIIYAVILVVVILSIIYVKFMA